MMLGMWKQRRRRGRTCRQAATEREKRRGFILGRGWQWWKVGDMTFVSMVMVSPSPTRSASVCECVCVCECISGVYVRMYWHFCQ